MQRLVFALLLLLASLSASAQTWATATSSNGSRVIVFRYLKELGPSSQRLTQPDRIIITWKYRSGSGMPSRAERERMDALEDLLKPTIEGADFSTLALVSTGENLREWIYYTKSEPEFFNRLNTALRGQPAFPIEIHASPDPQWVSYEKFKGGVKQ
jgi:hypothetical protein